MNCLNHYGFTKNWFYFPWTSLLFLFARVPNRSWILTECRLSLSVILWRFFVVPAEVSPPRKISAKVLPFAGKGMFADHWVAVLHLLSILSFNTDNFETSKKSFGILQLSFCLFSLLILFGPSIFEPHDPAQGSVYLYFGSKLLFTFFTGFSLLSFSRRVFSGAATAQFLCQQPTTWSAFGARLHSKMDDHVCFKDDKPAFSRRGAVAPWKISACGTLSGSGWVNLGVFRTECDGQALI